MDGTITVELCAWAFTYDTCLPCIYGLIAVIEWHRISFMPYNRAN